jgi:hypothetical protein
MIGASATECSSKQQHDLADVDKDVKFVVARLRFRLHAALDKWSFTFSTRSCFDKIAADVTVYRSANHQRQQC